MSTSGTIERIAFIGLGNMGAPMARNLLKAGFTVSVYDLAPSAVQALADAGAVAAPSASAAVEGAQAVISMLPAGRHVEQLYLMADGVLAALAPGALVIDCSTIEAATARALAAACAVRGLPCVDAPVSGGTAGAQAGTLTFMVGGEAPALALAGPLLSAMGKTIFHAGGAGAGQVAKACNNMLLGILMAGTAEALALGVAHGLDATVLSEIMLNSSGSNWALQKYNPYPGVMEGVPAARGYQGGFAVDLMAKDLALAQDAAVAARCAAPLGGLARNLYALHSLSGAGGQDFSSIITPLLK